MCAAGLAVEAAYSLALSKLVPGLRLVLVQGVDLHGQ